MTVEEFYQSTDFPELDKHDRKSAMFTYYDMLDFAERYAGQSAPKWISGEESPPVDTQSIEENHSITVIVETPYCCCEGFMDLENGIWFSANGYKIIVNHWMLFPQPPKQ